MNKQDYGVRDPVNSGREPDPPQKMRAGKTKEGP